MSIRIKIFLLFALLSYFPALAQVDTAWVRRYNGPGNFDDYPRTLAVDHSGNVCVTGFSYGSETFDDYATIKYSSTGVTLWVRYYNGAGNWFDRANALVLDESENVYVTGYSSTRDSVIRSDYTTIKYSPNGDTFWIRHYNGPENDADEAVALAVGNSGNVYVTGYSAGSGTGTDYVTIKYNSNGDTLWVRRYIGPGGLDLPVALVMADSGNAYVTGESWSATGSDYATVKYSNNGEDIWTRQYNGLANGIDRAKSLIVDDDGNVYVTGMSVGSGTNYDYATVKYAPNGDTLWVRRYNGPGYGEDAAQAISVDKSGNVYVTGYSLGAGLYPNYDYATVKYAPNGDTLWVRRYNGPYSGNDVATALAVDDNGNVYVTGYSRGSGGNDDFATIKYSPNGDVLWVIRYNGPGNGSDQANDIEVDGEGSVYVTGSSAGSGTSLDYITIKYYQCLAIPGDANGDGQSTFPDLIFKVDYVFKGGPKPVPLCGGDDNADGKVNLTDIIYEVNYIFKDGPSPLKSAQCCL